MVEIEYPEEDLEEAPGTTSMFALGVFVAGKEDLWAQWLGDLGAEVLDLQHQLYCSWWFQVCSICRWEWLYNS